MVDDGGGLDALPRDTVVASWEDLLAKAGRADQGEMNDYLSGLLSDDFAEVDFYPDTFVVYLPSTGGGMGLNYPFTLAALDELFEALDIAYDEWLQEYDDLAGICAAAGDGTVAGLEAAMSEWAMSPVTVSRRAKKHLIATGPGGREELEYPVTVHQVRNAAYGLHGPLPPKVKPAPTPKRTPAPTPR